MLPLETLAGMVVLPLITGEIAHALPGAVMGFLLGLTGEAMHELSTQYKALPSSTPNDQVE